MSCNNYQEKEKRKKGIYLFKIPATLVICAMILAILNDTICNLWKELDLTSTSTLIGIMTIACGIGAIISTLTALIYYYDVTL
jgi:hypothetical protein